MPSEVSKSRGAQLADKLLNQVLTGKFRPGDRIKEESVAESYGVSRTPIREALVELKRLGLVCNEKDKGYRVSDLTAREARELYPLIWTLEAMALENSPQLNGAFFDALESANVTFEKALAKRDVLGSLKADTAWHEKLVGFCRNRRLLGLLKDLKIAIQRYEIEFMTSESLPIDSVREHKEITLFLKAGDSVEACEQLKHHWRKGMALLLQHLDWS